MSGPETVPTSPHPEGLPMTDTMTPAPAPAAPRNGSAIRILTAVVGGTLALGAIGLAAGSQFAIAGASAATTVEAIPAAVTSIDVETSIGDITVLNTPGAAPTVTIESRRLPWSRLAAPTIDVSEGELSIDAGDRRPGPCLFSCGAISIVIELGGRELTELEARSDVGDIHLQRVSADTVLASSNIGDILVEDVDARDIETASDVGTVTLVLAEATRSAEVTTSVGDIRVFVPSGVEYAVQASSDVGQVRVDARTSPSASRAITASSNVGSVTISSDSSR